MGPNTSENFENLAKTLKNLAKTSKNFAKIFAKTFFTAQYVAPPNVTEEALFKRGYSVSVNYCLEQELYRPWCYLPVFFFTKGRVKYR